MRSTVSVGISFGEDKATTLEQMLLATDGALYAAKRNLVAGVGAGAVDVAGGEKFPESELLFA